MRFVNVCVKNQQMQQLFVQFINYVRYLLHVSELHCHPPGSFQVPSERGSVEGQSIEFGGGACCALGRGACTTPLGNVMPKHVGVTIHN
jgi:hypothetical protein